MEEIKEKLRDLILNTELGYYLRWFTSDKKEYQIHFVLGVEVNTDIVIKDPLNKWEYEIATISVSAVVNKAVDELECLGVEIVKYTKK